MVDWIKQPETITWPSGTLFLALIAAIVWLVSYGTHCQYKLDMKYGEKPETETTEEKTDFNKEKNYGGYHPDLPEKTA